MSYHTCKPNTAEGSIIIIMIKKFIYNNVGRTWQEAATTIIVLALSFVFWIGLVSNGFRNFSRGPLTWTDIFNQLFM